VSHVCDESRLTRKRCGFGKDAIWKGGNGVAQRGKELTSTSPKLAGVPVSKSTTSRMPSGGHLCRSRISRATRASVFGGRFSLKPPLELLEYARYEPEDIAVQRTRDQRESSSEKAMGVTLET
jgi:hypothetical protein